MDLYEEFSMNLLNKKFNNCLVKKFEDIIANKLKRKFVNTDVINYKQARKALL